MASACFARMEMRDLGVKRSKQYTAILNHVLQVLYRCNCVVYGGAVRDLIKGVCPRDIDAMTLGDVDVAKIVDELCVDEFCAEKIKCAAARSRSADECYTIHVDVGKTLRTNAPMIVIDLSVASTIDIVQYNNVEDALDQLEADYNVNMLYISRIANDYDCTAVFPQEHRTRGNDLVFDWGTVSARACQKFAVDIDFAAQCIFTATAIALGCNGVYHSIIAPIEAHQRAQKLHEAGYRDLTEYKCLKQRCRRSSVESMIRDFEKYLSREDGAAEVRYTNLTREGAKNLVIRAYNVARDEIDKKVSNRAAVETVVRQHIMVTFMMQPHTVKTHDICISDVRDRVNAGAWTRDDVLRNYAEVAQRSRGPLSSIYTSTHSAAERLRDIAKKAYDRAIELAVNNAMES